MQVTQIAKELNEWIAERCGDARFDADTAAQFIVREDLANIVDIGTAVYKYEWQDNFVKSMIDRIGRMVFVNRRTRGFAPDLQRNAWEYGSVMSKSRTKRFEAKENPSWKLQKGQVVEQFVFEPPTVRNKYYNIKIAWQIDCSFAEIQVREAFTSPGEMGRFFAMIESAIQQALDDHMARPFVVPGADGMGHLHRKAGGQGIGNAVNQPCAGRNQTNGRGGIGAQRADHGRIDILHHRACDMRQNSRQTQSPHLLNLRFHFNPFAAHCFPPN